MPKFHFWNDPDDEASGEVEIVPSMSCRPDVGQVLVRRIGAKAWDTFSVQRSELSEPRRFYKTTVTFVVLSEEPIPPHVDLEYIQREAMEGRYVGRFGDNTEVALNGAAMAQELTDFGSDPGFFELTPEGDKVND